MPKNSGGRGATNLLRISGILFGTGGSFHLLRYFMKFEFRVGTFELTPLGSLIVGSLLIFLSVSCFMHARK